MYLRERDLLGSKSSGPEEFIGREKECLKGGGGCNLAILADIHIQVVPFLG